jgi:hypothetical protein
MAEISVRVESRAEAEWLWSRLLGARIEDGPIRVVLGPFPAGDSHLARVLDAVEQGLRLRSLSRARLEHEGRTWSVPPNALE